MGASPSSIVLAQLPELLRCDCIHLTEHDTLIHAPGFEDRTMAFANGMTVDSQARAILLDYRPVNPKNRLPDVRKTLSDLGMNIADGDLIIYDRFSPDDFEDTLEAHLTAQQTQRAVVDISTMSKLAIMLVLQVCQRMNLDTQILYSEANSYGPTQEEFELARKLGKIHQPSLHVFSGVHGVVRVDSLASVAMQGQPTAAIVFMSFNDALTQLLLNTVYPGRLFLINGCPPIHSWREAATAWVHEEVRREWEADNPVGPTNGAGVALPSRIASTLDYRDSMALLLDLYWHLSATHRVLLAPSGSKMQTVACYLMKALHPDIHIEYPSPEGFAPEYSSGVGARWLVSLGNFVQRLSAVQNAERQQYLEIDSDVSASNNNKNKEAHHEQ
jgi:hypothetical protein